MDEYKDYADDGYPPPRQWLPPAHVLLANTVMGMTLACLLVWAAFRTR